MKNSHPTEPETTEVLQQGAWQLLALPLAFFLAIPVISLVLRVPYDNLFTTLKTRQVLQAIDLSVWTSLVSVGVILLTGTPLAYWLAQKRKWLWRVVDTLVDLPTVLPPAVAGIALLIAFGRRGVVGTYLNALGITLPFTPIAVIMAQLFIASPLFIKTAVVGFGEMNYELKQAAALDGASDWQIFRYISFPLARFSLLSGGVLAWTRALGEFGATMIFAGNFPGRTQTMPLAIYLGFEIDLDVALALSFVMVGFSALALIVVKRVLHHRIDRG